VAGAGEHDGLTAAIADPAAAARLSCYLDLLAAWSTRTNLTAARTPAARYDLLVRPVLPLAAGLAPGTLIDIGSGNGSPGLVLAALRPDIRATLLEPRVRRWAFLREAARAMDVRVDVRRQRHDEYDGPPARTVTVRALALPAGDLAALAEQGGRVIVWGVAPLPHPDLVLEEPFPGGHAYRRR
jgi:16S rRNA (guanine527-N7)-methyltransferase